MNVRVRDRPKEKVVTALGRFVPMTGKAGWIAAIATVNHLSRPSDGHTRTDQTAGWARSPPVLPPLSDYGQIHVVGSPSLPIEGTPVIWTSKVRQICRNKLIDTLMKPRYAVRLHRRGVEPRVYGHLRCLWPGSRPPRRM